MLTKILSTVSDDLENKAAKNFKKYRVSMEGVILKNNLEIEMVSRYENI